MEQAVEDAKKVTPRSVGVKYGLIAGLISIVMFLVTVIAGINPFGSVSNWLGVCFTIVLMVLAHKNFKDSGDGFMSYGQGIGISFWMTIVSTLLGIGVMALYLNAVDSGPMDMFYDEQRAKMEEAGQSEQAIEIAMEWTSKLFWVFAVIGGIFWGMLIALILTIFTQKKAPEQVY